MNMRKIYKLLIPLIFMFTLMSCASGSKFVESFLGEKLFGFTQEETFRNNLKSYRLEANIKTTKGDLRFYLYPEAAPKLVANFVFLATNGYYDNLPFHRVNINNIIQSGDRKGDGTGTPGYSLDDEFSFLKFDRAGILAMANAGPNTNGSQIFITLQRVEEYNNKYSIIGSLKNSDDLAFARLIRQDDKILSIEITGVKVETFLDNFKEDVKTWENALKKEGYLK